MNWLYTQYKFATAPRGAILDISSGSSPFWRANILMDRFIDKDSQEPGKLIVDRPESPSPISTDQTVRKPSAILSSYHAVLLMVIAAILVPIWIVDYPGMVDYPNHLTRCYVLAHYSENLLWQQRYLLVREPIPNLAIEIVVVPLLRFLPLIVSGKVFLTLAGLVYVVGCSEIGRAVTGKPSWLALVVAFTFYNSQLLYGFVNYVFGVGVFLCAFAYWLRVRKQISPSRFLICCLFSVAAYLAHLSSVVFLGTACCIISVIDFIDDRKVLNAIVKTVWLACPVFLMTGFLKGSGHIGKVEWASTLGDKLIPLLSPIRSYNTTLDVTVVVILVLCALVMLKHSKVHPIALVSLAFFALFLITPHVLFTSSAADARYLIPSYLLLILSIEPNWERWQKVALVLALVTMFVRTGDIAANWLEISHRAERAISMGNILPTGARIYVVQTGGLTELSQKRDRGMVHVIQFWTVTHNAELSTFFTIPGQQPLVYRQSPCHGPGWTACLASYDFVWTYDPPMFLRQILLGIATPAATWENITLWRVRRANTLPSGKEIRKLTKF